MTLETCTEMVRTQDPDRFGAALVAAPEDRPALITLYALNLEIARAPFQSAEPMLAEIRLQWWHDRLAEMARGTPPPLHDVLTPLWDSWGSKVAELVPLTEARRRDCAREPFTDPQAVVSYIDGTAGQLMWQAARHLGAPTASRRVVADHALGAGLVAWLRALPRLQPLGLGLAGAKPEEPVQLAEIAREALRRASRAHRALPRRTVAALFSGPRVPRFLAEVVAGRIDCFTSTPEITPFQRRAALARLAVTGRWWR